MYFFRRALLCAVFLTGNAFLTPAPAAEQESLTQITAKSLVLTPRNFELDKFTSELPDGVYQIHIPQQPDISNETRGLKLLVSPSAVAGKSIRLKAQVRYSGIDSDTKQGDHVGGKILFSYKTPGRTFYATSKPSLRGDGSWQEITAICSFPLDITSITIRIGIQQAWGEMEIRNITLESERGDSGSKLKVPQNFRCEYSTEILNRPAMRGIVSPPPEKLTEEDIKTLGKWGVNLLRLQLVGNVKLTDMQNYTRFIDQCLAKLDSLENTLRENRIKVIIDLHFTPGGRFNNGKLLGTAGEKAAQAYGELARFRMMENEEYRQKFLDTWKMIATRYRNNPLIYGYGLVNEPVQNGPVRFHWLDLQYDAAQAIRAIDPDTPVIVQTNNWASAGEFASLVPFPLKNVIYEMHMYYPGPYTHQGIGDKDIYVKNYPHGSLDYASQKLNPAKLESVMQSAVDFQKKYGAKLLVGEFSVVIWAPGGEQYLNDLISVFEKHQWDWCYHAFREWPGWSLEHEGTPDNIRNVTDNPRKTILLQYFKKNNI